MKAPRNSRTQKSRNSSCSFSWLRPVRSSSVTRTTPLLLPLLLLHPLLLLQLAGVRGTPLAPPPASPALAATPRQGGPHPDEASALSQDPGAPFPVKEKERSNSCSDYDRQEEPQVLYAEELFARMLALDSITSGLASDVSELRQNWERITATCVLDLTPGSHVLTFNTNWVKDMPNVTLALVLVVTYSSSHKNGCQPQLKASKFDRPLPCENKPFHINNMAAVDVTSLLTQQKRRDRFEVYAKRMRHVTNAVLVVFNDLDPRELFQDDVLRRCRSSEMPEPQTLHVCPRKKGHPRTPRSATRHSASGSVQSSPFQTPAQLHHYLNERRKRSVSNHSQGLDTVTRAPGACHAQSFEVHSLYDLDIGDIIHPTLLDIGQCVGMCPPIVQPSGRVPYYSYLVSLLHTLNPQRPWPIPPPTCRPFRFQSFSVMMLAGEELITERLPHARVIECACL